MDTIIFVPSLNNNNMNTKKEQYIVTFGFNSDDGDGYRVSKSKPITAESEEEAAIMVKDQFESYEGIACDIISITKLS
jgi:hypothetical protein